ncbi:MAG: hypothetical protein LUG21_08770 [Clostridiales bacterium]|nr:hypothetical protein [Clostridiales bacterium]
MKLKITLSVSSVMCVLLCFAQMITIYYVSFYNNLKYSLLAIVGLYVFTQYKLFLKKKYFGINALLVIFSAAVILTTYLAVHSFSSTYVISAALFIIRCFVMVLFAEIMAEKNKVKTMINTFYNIILTLVILMDLLIYALPGLAQANGGVYLLGNKFNVFYFHLFLIALYVSKARFSGKKRYFSFKLMIFFLVSIITTFYVDCVTGVAGIVIMFIYMLVLYNEKAKKFFLNGFVQLATQVFSLLFVFIYNGFLSSSFVKYVITDIFNRDLTLTKRTVIWNNVLNLIQGNLLYGFGYGSSYDIGEAYGFPNAQNAVLEWIFQCGIITTVIMIAMFVLFMIISKRNMDSNKIKISASFVALLYTLTLLGTVEITMGNMYITAFAFIIAISCKREGKNNPADLKIRKSKFNVKKI